jgi:hypothetical protein
MRMLGPTFVAFEPAWRADWVWGLPSIVLTVVFHILCLGPIRIGAVRGYIRTSQRYSHMTRFVVMGTTTLFATIGPSEDCFLHG